VSGHPDEPHAEGLASQLNWLRAGVLGANDGIVSVAAVLVGVASATDSLSAIITAGVAAVIGGAISMALGEYVSVSSARDQQYALIEKEKRELQTDPAAELEELAQLYEQQGLSPATARTVAEELTAKDALSAHLEAELKMDADDIASPFHAALASAVSFLIGAALPSIAILVSAPEARIVITVVATIVSLAITGATAAKIGGAPVPRATARVVIGGALALAATYLIGALLDTTGVA
jgi:VIT1/CCC1 family predicted Fe2+/Mn2+ transporter